MPQPSQPQPWKLVQRSHYKWFYVRIVAFLQTIFLHPHVFLFLAYVCRCKPILLNLGVL